MTALQMGHATTDTLFKHYRNYWVRKKDGEEITFLCREAGTSFQYLDYQIPSDEALQHAFETPTSRSRNSSVVRNPQSGVGANLQSRCNHIVTALY
jgi:hypothetical protein